MQTDVINLIVPSEIAQAFRNASPEAQEQASQKALEVLRYTLMNRADAVREFNRMADQMAKTARDRGMTDELLQYLLDEKVSVA